jgi:LysR family transcriptional regulator, hydrogen peroxide-inducible genes activator
MSITTLPSPRQLRYLVALAEHRHFARAAAACNVTQSTLSAGLKELEALLGATLVERSRRSVTLTPLGEEILTRARRVLAEAEELVDAARAGAEPLAGPLRLGVIPTIGPYLMPRALARFRRSFPRLQLYIREEQTAPLLEKVASAALDLALIALPYEVGDLETMAIAEDEIMLAAPATHPLAARKQVDHAVLRGEPLLLLEDGHCLRAHALAACELTGAGRNEVFQGTSLRTLVQMVAGGLGLTLIPRLAVPIEAPAGGAVRAVPLGPGKHVRTLVLAWRRKAARSEAFRRLGTVLANVASVRAG